MIRNELRGRDSWGVVTYDGNKMKMLKQVGPIGKSGAIKRITANQVLAHTRKATTGNVTQLNAHPFDMGKIIGAHNGIISNHDSLQKKYKRSFEVDSQHLLAHINDGLPISEVSGYGTVTYIDKNKPGEVFLGVGATGDLAVAGIGIPSKTTGIVWSSTWNAIEDALDISGIPKYYQIKIDQSMLYRVVGCDIYKAGKFSLSYGSQLYPANYNDGIYSYNHCGYEGNNPLQIGTTQKKVPCLSRKKRKKLSKAMRALVDVTIAAKRGLSANHTTNMMMPLSSSPHTHVGYA